MRICQAIIIAQNSIMDGMNLVIKEICISSLQGLMCGMVIRMAVPSVEVLRPVGALIVTYYRVLYPGYVKP